MGKIFSTLKGFFSFVSGLALLAVCFFTFCGVPKFLQPTDYISTVKGIETQIPYDNQGYERYTGTIETYAENFFRYFYSDFDKYKVHWSEKGKLENGKLIEARYEEAYIEIRAIKNGDYIEIKPIEIDFHGPDGERYNVINAPVVAAG